MSIDERLAQVESELHEARANLLRMRNRNTWSVGVLIILLCMNPILWLFSGSASATEEIQPNRARTVTASEIHIVDEAGRQRIVLDVGADGATPRLLMRDANNKLRAALLLIQGHPQLAMYDENQTNRIALMTTPMGPGLRMNDENTIRRIILSADEGKPTLALIDNRTVPRIVHRVDGDVPTISLRDSSGNPTWMAPN